MALSFTDTRHLVLVTPSAGYVMDLDGKQKRIDFGGNVLISYDINENGCAFLLDGDPVHENSRVVVCDKRGDMLCDRTLDTDLTALALGKDHTYLLGTEALWRVLLEGERTDVIAVQSKAERILLTDGGQLRLVRAGAAEYVEFD